MLNKIQNWILKCKVRKRLGFLPTDDIMAEIVEADKERQKKFDRNEAFKIRNRIGGRKPW